MPQTDQKKQSILVVDDEPSNIEVIIQSLVNSEYNILAATNGEMACMLAKSSQPDLIILDWQMQGMSGLDVINTLKNDETTKDIVIIMATAVHKSSVNLKQALEAGAFDFLRKPFDTIELEARVNSALMFKASQNTIQQQQNQIFKQKEEQLKEEIEVKERELITGALQISKQYELNEYLIAGLTKILPEVNLKTNKVLQNLINTYKIKTVNNHWQEFKARFTLINSNFYTKLRQQIPDLTPNEEKICAFLKLNMTSNEISSITLQSTESIRKATLRLRNKLNLCSKEELIHFLSSL